MVQEVAELLLPDHRLEGFKEVELPDAQGEIFRQAEGGQRAYSKAVSTMSGWGYVVTIRDPLF